MNEKLTDLTLSDLLDKLSEYTAVYSKMMLNGASADRCADLQLLIQVLQQEISRRKDLLDKPIESTNSISSSKQSNP